MRQRGFTYLLVLFLVALGGVVMAGASQLWWMNSKRDKEDELLFAGRQIRQAIESYYRATPGAQSAAPATGTTAIPAGRYPRTLDDLLEDRRYFPPRRHLRRIFVEPITGSKEWGLVRQGEQLLGVYSLSPARPLRGIGFLDGEEEFAEAVSYQDWRFIANPAPSAKPGPPEDTARQAQPAPAPSLP